MFVTLSKIACIEHNEDTGTDVERTIPAVINAAAIRCWYARRDSRPGTRLTFTDGGGFAVSETPAEVSALVVAQA